MDTNKQEPEKEFHFIQEKVIPKRKRKLKRYIVLTAGTVLLAVVFGLVARYVFIVSEDWMCRLLGIDPRERKEITFPSVTPTVVPNISPTAVPPSPTPADKKNQGKNPKEDLTAEDYIKMMSDVRKIADKVNTSIVTIAAIESGVDWSNDPYEKENITTGFIIGENNVDLLIVTQLEQVRGATRMKVTFANNTTAEAYLWNYDTDYNLAVISVSMESLGETTLELMKPAELGESYILSIGMPVIALGNPNGYSGSMELGMITKKGLYTSVVDNRLDLFQMDLVNYENSGGVIVNFSGEVIGVISQKLKKDSNVFTAVGISKLKPVIQRLANKTDCIYFGVHAEEPPKEILTEAGVDGGIFIEEVDTNSPAFHYGVKRGDIITEMGGYKISSVGILANVLSGFKPGDSVSVTIRRMSKQVYKDVELKVTLGIKTN